MIGLPESFLKQYYETHSPATLFGVIASSIQSGASWATALLNWAKRKEITINGASKTATFTDDFTSYADTTAGDLAYPTSDTAKMRVNPTTDVIDWDAARDGSNNKIVYDLTSVDDDKWTLRFKWVVGANGGTGTHLFIGIGDGDETVSATATTNTAIHCMIRGATTNDIYFASESNGTLNGATLVNMNTSPAVGTYYIEFKKIENLKGQMTIYSDSDYSEVISTSGIQTIESTNSLRYFFVCNYPTGTASGFTGTIDDIQFYNGETTVENIPSQQTATFTDDFTGTDDWTDSDNTIIGVNVGTDVMDVTERATVGDEVTYKTLTALGTDADFVYRNDFTITAFTQSATVEMLRTTVGLSSADDITQVTTRDEVGVTWQLGNSGGINKFYCFTADAAQLPTSGTDFSLTPTASTTYYIEIVGNAGTYTFNIFSDSSYSVLLESKSIVDAGITALDNMVVRSTAFTTHNQTVDVAIQQINRWDNVTEVNPATLTDYPLPIVITGDADLMEKTTETLDEDFTSSGATSHTVDDTTVGGWLAKDVSNTLINGTDDRLDFNIVSDSTNDSISYDLGSALSETKWVIDWDLHITAEDVGGTSDKVLSIGISDLDSGTSWSTSQDWIGIKYLHDSDSHIIDLRSTEAQVPRLTASDASFTNLFDVGVNYYLRFIRLSSTKYTLQIYVDSARTILWEEQSGTITSACNGLRYLKVMNSSATTDTGSITGYIKKIRVWDGITNPVNQEVATFADDFTSYADQTAIDAVFPWSGTAGYRGNATTDVIDFGGAYSTSNRAVVHDLTSIDSDNFIFTGKIRFSTLSVGVNYGVTMIYLSDTDESVGASTVTQNSIGIAFLVDAGSGGQEGINILYGDGQNVSWRATTDWSPNFVVSTDYWYKVQRINDDITVKMFSNSDMTIEIGTVTTTLPTHITGLRYWKTSNSNEGGYDGQIAGTLEDIQIWDGISSPNAEGRKVVFTNNAFDGDAVEYASETTSYDPINGDWTGYVKIPSLATGADTTIQMYYDYAATTPSYTPELMPIGTRNETLGDDFTSSGATSHTSDNTTVGGWLAQDISENLINGSTDKIDLNIISDSTQDSMSYDLGDGNVSDDRWVLRINKLNFSSLGSKTGDNAFWIGIGDDDSTIGRLTAKDFIGCSLDYRTGNDLLRAHDVAGAGLGTTGDDNFAVSWTTGVDYYIEIIRLSDISYSVALYTDEHFTNQVGIMTEVTTATVNALRYISLRNIDNSTLASTNWTGTIDSIQFWNDITSIGNREQSTFDTNYKAVHHLQGNSTDSTVYGNDGTDTAVVYEQQNGSVGAGFNATTSKVDIATDTSIDNIFDGGGHITVSFDINSDGEASTAVLINKKSGINSGWRLQTVSESSGFVKIKFTQDTDGTDGVWDTTNAVVPINSFNIIEVDYNSDSVSNNPILIINGIKYTVGNGLTETATPTGTRVNDASKLLVIGNETGQAFTTDGFIDNARISDVSRPSSEAITSYNAEKSDTDITTAGAENTQ